VSHVLLQRLKLRVKEAKSAVDKSPPRTVLGFTCTGGKRPNRRKSARKSVARVSDARGPIALLTAYFDALGLPRVASRPNMERYRTALVRTRMPGAVGGGKS
jgi:hypothetical protein